MPIKKYGREWNTNSLLTIELMAFRLGLTPETGGLGRHKHFENLIREVFPEFVWYDEAYEQADALCNYPVTGFMAGASFTKSDLLGKYGLFSWWCDPVNTLVIFCSTTSKDAKLRVWGHVQRDFRRARAQQKAVGRLIESQAIIKLSESDDGVAVSDNSSIVLVAAGNEDKADALKRLQGFKNKRVILLVDEGQDVSQTIIDEALWNLSANQYFEAHIVGNGTSRFDTLGNFMKPVDGWPMVNRKTHRWKIQVGTKTGIALHFDATAENSTNMKRFTQGIPQLPFLRKAEDCLAARMTLGENNPTYLKQFVGFPPEKEDESNFIVSDQALASHDAYDKAEWKSAPTEIAGIDPSYSNDGDRFVFFHCRWGLDVQSHWLFQFYESVIIHPEPVKGETKDFAAMRQCKRLAEERKISPRHIGMDASAGTPLLSIFHQMWSADILAVPFGGAATDLKVSAFDNRIASDLYANATSELAYVLVEFLNAGQIRGVKPDHARELVNRKFEFVAGGKIRIEKKKDFKARMGFSPDLADAGHVALRVLRERLRIQAGASSPQAAQQQGDWRALARRRDVVSLTQGARAPHSDDPVEAAHRALANARTIAQKLMGRR